MGLAGYAFLDYGDSHTVTDANGSQTQQYIIDSITNEEHAVVILNSGDKKRHSFSEGDFVKFSEVEGMT